MRDKGLGIEELGLERLLAAMVLVITSIALVASAFDLQGNTVDTEAKHMSWYSVMLFSALGWLAASCYLIDGSRFKTEHVRVWFEDGTSRMADVHGASKIPEGHARTTTARFYSSMGEPLWTVGAGYRKVVASRKDRELQIRELRK